MLKKLADEDKGSVMVEKDLALWYGGVWPIRTSGSLIKLQMDSMQHGAGRVVAEGLLARGVNDGIVLTAYGLLLMNEGVALMILKRYSEAIETLELMDKTFVELATRDLGEKNHLGIWHVDDVHLVKRTQEPATRRPQNRFLTGQFLSVKQGCPNMFRLGQQCRRS